jgi:hypothetical protein
MFIDPAVNLVVFKIQSDEGAETFLKEVETQATDGIQQAWNELSAENSLTTTDIVAIFSEWSASDQDVEFLKTVFAGVEFSYRFERPENEGDWDAAFAEATQALVEDSERDTEEGPADEPTSDSQEPTLLPVLRNDDEMMSEIGLHQSIGAGLSIALANVKFTPRGTIGIDYLMAANVEDSEDARDDLFVTAFNNLAGALQIQVKESDKGDSLVVVSHPLDHGASALCLPDLYENAKTWLDSEELFVGIPDPGTLLILRGDSPEIERLTKSVISSEYWGSVALTPAVFKLTEDGLERVATRETAAE